MTIQAVNEKQVETDFWKEKALMLAGKFKACLNCGSQKDWKFEVVKCKKCYDNE